MTSIRSLRCFLPLMTLVLALAACDTAPMEPPMVTDHAASHSGHAALNPANSMPGLARGDLLKAVQQTNTRCNSTTQPLRSGYMRDDHCVAHPHLGGYPLDVGGVPPLMEEGIPHYSLHVWAHKDNPSGVFSPFNPNVTCS